MKNILKHPVVKHRYFRKFVGIVILLLIFLVFGYRQFRQVIYIPEDGSAFRIDNYSLGKAGDKPFYQTDDDLRLLRELSLSDSKILYYFSKQYYKYYKKHYAKGKVMTQMVEVGKNQLPEIYDMVKDACKILGVEKIPDIYITNSRGTRLSVTNRLNPIIVISSDLLWAFRPEELRFLLARQVAHIRLEHLFYLDMLAGMRSFTEISLPKFVSRVIVGSVGVEMMQWYKEAEVSADRGALVVTGDIKVALQALVKLNIGANYENYYSTVNIDAYLEQLSKLEEDRIETASAVIHELENPNPFITVRCRHLLSWYKENDAIFK